MKFLTTTEHGLQVYQLEKLEELAEVDKILNAIHLTICLGNSRDIKNYYVFYKDGIIKYLYYNETRANHHSVAAGKYYSQPNNVDVYEFAANINGHPFRRY